MRTLFLTALLAASMSLPAHAGALLDLAIVDRDTGATLPTWSDDGKLYIAGTPGHRYAVRLSNRTGSRVLAVLSVDGVNAISGETASPRQSGYVLDAWESTEISGWRKSLDEIAQFTFTALPNSYAARTGRPANVGVIGVAVFPERIPYRRQYDEIAREASPAGSASPMPAPPTSATADAHQEAAPMAKDRSLARSSERLGTGHGEREVERVGTTTFERASRTPAETLALWYESYANLVAQGIIDRPIARRHQPTPFPDRFVADPPGR